jgi:hypothetical protein
MVSVRDNSRGEDAYEDVHALLLRLSHCEAKRYLRMKNAHEELITLLITVVVLLAIILFIMIWKLC